MYFCGNLLEKIMMEESRLLFEISEDIVARENVSADDLQEYLENPCLLYTSPSPRDA